jgi:DNA-binding LacI/PurR family transcriptional regulator
VTYLQKPNRDRLKTSYDVAIRAGVSQSAVSRCFSGAGSVSPQTRARIVAAADALGYRPNAFASGLVTRRSNLVAVVISSSTCLYYPEILTQLSKKLSTYGVRALLFTFELESEIESLLDQVHRYQVDGAIVAAPLNRAQIRAFNASSIALVLYNFEAVVERTASVRCDFLKSEAILIDGLIAAGCRSFGIISGPIDNGTEAESMRAVLDYLAVKGIIDVPLERGDFSYESGYSAAISLITREKVDAIISANDIMALGAIDAARLDCNIAVPSALSIVGSNGVGKRSGRNYNLTTIVQPNERMAEAAVAMLMDRIKDPELGPEQRIFLGDLIRGDSARLVL